jgi:hypothetical protein
MSPTRIRRRNAPARQDAERGKRGTPPPAIWHDRARSGLRQGFGATGAHDREYPPGARVGKGWKFVAVEEFRRGKLEFGDRWVAERSAELRPAAM